MSNNDFYQGRDYNEVRDENRHLLAIILGHEPKTGEQITCSRCGFATGDKRKIVVHHRHYRTFGNESAGDIVILCKPCHKDIHNRINSHSITSDDAAFVDPETGFDSAEKTCPACGKKMVKRVPRPKNGRFFNPFWGCSDYPNCYCTLPLDGKK